MAEYIEREKALTILFNGEWLCDDDVAYERISNLPAADVAPVRHGRWMIGCVCSLCGDIHGPRNAHQAQYYKFCPNCGAKMDGGNENV